MNQATLLDKRVIHFTVKYPSLWHMLYRGFFKHIRTYIMYIVQCTYIVLKCTDHRPLSGVHSIMMEKSTQPGVGGGCRCTPIPFTISTITYKVVVNAPAERADTLPLFLLCPLYVLCGTYIT